MKLRSLIAGLAFLGAVAAPGLAAAYTLVYATYDGRTNMRAGPGTSYPVIARILPGSEVNVVGCLSNFSWCDVVVQGYRGWVSTSRLEFSYATRRQVPVIGFSFGYWDRHYSDWPWYREWRRHHRRDRPTYVEPDPGPTYVYPDQQPTVIYPDPGVIYPDQGVIYPDQGSDPTVIYPDDAAAPPPTR